MLLHSLNSRLQWLTTMTLSKAVISLVVVSLVATAYAATEAQESLTFAEWSANAAGSAQAGAAWSHYKKSANVKHLCLKEKKQGECRYVGCAGIVNCNTNAGDCGTCQTHVVGQSELECCQDTHDYYHKDSEDEPSTLTPILTAAKVGTCDWDADLFTCNTADDPDCSPGIQMENGAEQLGTAWATCYLNPGSEECGHPFCDRMVLSFQGGLYFTQAYAKGVFDPMAGVETDGSWPELSATAPDGSSEVDLPPSGCFVPAALAGTIATANQTAGGNRTTARASRAAASANRQIHSTTNLLKRMIAKHPEMLRGNARGQRRNASIPHEYYNGVALMFSGAITVTSLDKHVEYSHGLMEYVPFFWGFGEPIVGRPSVTALVVKPNTYSIQLVDGPKDDYKGGDEYKGDSDKGYYKESDAKGY